MILPGDHSKSIADGTCCIRAGHLLGLPTETVYGLAADAENAAAVAQIFATKGRPADHPLIVHVGNAAAAAHFASDIPDFAQALMAAFWPGPLTLILPRRPGIASAAAGGHDSIGLRCPSHPVAQALLQSLMNCMNWGQITINLPEFDSNQKQSLSDPNCLVWGLAAPSANQFGRVSPTTAAHVQAEFGDDLLILDGGPCSVGIESTIIDCTRGQPVLLRPGAITPDQVQAVCGLKVLLKNELSAQAAPAPKASGTLESHYAPRAKVRLMDAAAMQLALAGFGGQGEPVRAALADPAVAAHHSALAPEHPTLAVWSRAALAVPNAQVLHLPMPQAAASAAQQLFAVLRNFDAQGVCQIWIETPPDAPEWDGVRDRLQRAAC